MVTMGLFAPLPLALMIPFMAGQSFAMGEAFGKGFQYGKRRISAMTNEEFNKMDASDHFNETTADIKSMIPAMKSSMQDFHFLQQDVIRELLGYIKQTAGTVLETVEETGTELAQQSLDNLRALVGMPPLYAKLVSPAGINALMNFWQDKNLIEAFKLASNPTTWIFNQLKEIFNQNPPHNTILTIMSWMRDNQNKQQEKTLEEPGVIEPPKEEVPTVQKDTRHQDKYPPSIRAPSSVKTQFNKYNAELRALKTIIDQETANASFGAKHVNAERKNKAKARRQIVHKAMLQLWYKYDLEGKVSSSNYNYHTSLVTHH